MPYFFRKLEKTSQDLSSAAVVIGPLRDNYSRYYTVYMCTIQMMQRHLNSFSSLTFSFYEQLELNAQLS